MRSDDIPDEQISQNIENTLNSSLQDIRSRIKDYSNLTNCVNPDCSEAPVKGFRFCGRECRDIFEKLIKSGRVHE